MKRFASFTIGVLSLLVISGCPGSLSNPDDFIDGGVVEKDAEMILAESCGTSGCHDATPQAQAGLDLISPNVESRVVDVNAVGLGCENSILVVAGDPDASYLLDRFSICRRFAASRCRSSAPLHRMKSPFFASGSSIWAAPAPGFQTGGN